MPRPLSGESPSVNARKLFGNDLDPDSLRNLDTRSRGFATGFFLQKTLKTPSICANKSLPKGIRPNSRLRANSTLRTRLEMDDGGLSAALDRAERAIERIQRAISSRKPANVGRDEELRAKVREVVEELDELIRQAAA